MPTLLYVFLLTDFPIFPFLALFHIPTQNSTLFPKYFDNLKAVSIVILLFPLIISEIRAAEIFVSLFFLLHHP
jgi:hypothetical protein